MQLYNAVIIDDEANIRKGLEVLIKEYCPAVRLIGSAGSAEGGRQFLRAHEIQLIFLDIAMPNENGFEFLKSIQKENYAIIFITAYQEFALKAIKANAVDYLLKPVDPSELKEAVERAVSYLNLRIIRNKAQNVYRESLENLTREMQGKSAKFTKITVPEQFGFRIVEVKNIRYLEADSNYSILHLSGLEKIVSSKSLGEFEKILDTSDFFRIHKSTILNMNYLKSFSNYQGHFAVLDDNTKLSISRRRVNEFREAVTYFSKSLD